MKSQKVLYFSIVFFALSVVHFANGEDFNELEGILNEEDLELISKIDALENSNEENTDSNEENTDSHSNVRTRVRMQKVPMQSAPFSCYGDGFLSKFASKILDMNPSSSQQIDTRFYLHTRQVKNPIRIFNSERGFHINKTTYSADMPSVFIVHGFMSNGNASWVNSMTRTLLLHEDLNVFTVDWSKGSHTWKYWKAVANTRTVGEDIGLFLQRLLNIGASTKNIHLIGHSLGSHICSYASNFVGRVGRITGLDPAEPCYETGNDKMLLDRTDADFVDVVHTNAKSFGQVFPCGHVDFYPNGGLIQPGCTVTGFLKSLSIRERIKNAVCNHGRAYELFIASIKQKCPLMGYPWNLDPKSVDSTINMQCQETNCTLLGYYADKLASRGVFYVPTSNKMPFCTRNAKQLDQIVSTTEQPAGLFSKVSSWFG